MCRWAAYIGTPIFLDTVLFDPSNSLVAQSKNAEESKTAINADGFGLAWYHAKPAPGSYRDVSPAWSDPNLASVATQVKSALFLAHVRASTGTAISRNNCHPFAVDNWSFMHNGQVGGYDQFRKKADMLIPEDLYNRRKGATDSEVLFLLAMGHGFERSPKTALGRAIKDMQNLSKKFGTGPEMRLSVAFSDGKTLYAARYASDKFAPTLYYQRNSAGNGWVVVSEPLDAAKDDWIKVENGAFCSFTAQSVQTEALF